MPSAPSTIWARKPTASASQKSGASTTPASTRNRGACHRTGTLTAHGVFRNVRTARPQFGHTGRQSAGAAGAAAG